MKYILIALLIITTTGCVNGHFIPVSASVPHTDRNKIWFYDRHIHALTKECTSTSVHLPKAKQALAVLTEMYPTYVALHSANDMSFVDCDEYKQTLELWATTGMYTLSFGTTSKLESMWD